MIPAQLLPFVRETPDSPVATFSGVDKNLVTYLQSETPEPLLAALSEVMADLGYSEDQIATELAKSDMVIDGLGSVVIVGTISNHDQVIGAGVDGEPIVVSPATAKPGWHVNLLP